jgi:pSer/pThr/pTyr-binding forkhead associated (FHA) protein
MLNQDGLSHDSYVLDSPGAVPMKVRLVIEQGAKRKVVNLLPPEAVVGRSRGNTVRIPSSEVSRQHCRLAIANGLVTIEDLGSVNGTFLNGQKIHETEVVRPGDTLEVGPVRFVVEYVLTPEALGRLQEMDNGIDALEALADGQAMELEDLPVLQDMEEEESLPLMELSDASEPEAEEQATPKPEEMGPLPVDFDFDATAWQVPDGGDLRDLLGQMDTDDEPPTKQHKPKR